jgi:galactokinase
MPDAPASPAFVELFGAPAEADATAPGRVNLLGEHTDYHDGFVLPTTIPQRTHAAVRARADRRVHVWSAGTSSEVEQYVLGSETPGRGWLDYVQGLTLALSRRGFELPGFDLRLHSAVPIGAGVSSSAALEVSVLRALRTRFALALDDVELARAAQAAETDFVGAPIGIMDQMASSVGRDGDVLFLDTRTLAFERIPLPGDADLVVIDSGIAHKHAGGDYATRRRESFDAAAQLGLGRLRDAGPDALVRLATLDPLLARRARHVITENQRVCDAVAALRRDDLQAFGRLMNASHTSMRDDYETSTPEIDLLVGIAQQDADTLGARLTGGGFGGAIVALVRAGAGAHVGARIVSAFKSAAGIDATVLVAGHVS